MWTDTHAHLYCEQFANDLPEVLQRARQAEIGQIVVPSEDLDTSAKVVDLCQKHDMLFPAVGIHPEHAGTFDCACGVAELEKLALKPEVVALGEMGLDYYWESNPEAKVQIECFQAQLDLALKLNKPVIIHNRNADADTGEILKKYAPRGLKGVLHCFSTTYEFAKLTLDCGLLISFAGQLTYPKSQPLRDVAKQLPLESLMLETDSPYLSPQKKRGKRNEPAHVVLTGNCLAQLLGITPEQMATASTANAQKLFALG